MTPEQERKAFAEWVKKHPDFSDFESYEIANLFDAWQASAALGCECKRKTNAVIQSEREL